MDALTSFPRQLYTMLQFTDNGALRTMLGLFYNFRDSHSRKTTLAKETIEELVRPVNGPREMKPKKPTKALFGDAEKPPPPPPQPVSRRSYRESDADLWQTNNTQQRAFDLFADDLPHLLEAVGRRTNAVIFI